MCLPWRCIQPTNEYGDHSRGCEHGYNGGDYVNRTLNCITIEQNVENTGRYYILTFGTLKKIVSISLSFILLFTNMGFAINTHYCGGEAIESSFTLGLQDLSCGMEDSDSPCREKRNISKTCCQNEHTILQLDENFSINDVHPNASSTFLVAFVSVFLNPKEFTDKNQVQFSIDPPPTVEKDVQALFQTFLI